ncbi:MAG: tripartite tricarboxylate transporter permease [Rhodospirillales bacterium]
MQNFVNAFDLLFRADVIATILVTSFFGLFVGAMPGLTATMATALLVPFTFFMEPVAAIAAIVTATAMAIFSGDIPGALLRIPGTPASAAYVDEAYAMTRKGQADQALGAGLIFSAVGGLFGTAVLILAAPALAEIALKFSSFEYFWLSCLGLTCAVLIATDRPLKGLIALSFGLLIACVGVNNPAGYQRFSFGLSDLLGGVSFIPVLIGMFAVPEVLRSATERGGARLADARIDSVFRHMGHYAWKYKRSVVRGSAVGTLIGALPGAGADIAAWISYALSKRFSKERAKFGTGHVEGIIESGAANNASLAGAWVPAMVFGIPGDSITAIAIGVLYLKGLNPGPTLFLNKPDAVYAIFMVFVLANVLMIPMGWLAIKWAKQLLRVPKEILMPFILLNCIVGSYAIDNAVFGVILMLFFGVVAFVMEENDFPVGPAILGLVLGPLVEENFIKSLIKADGQLMPFFERPIAGALGVVTLLIWFAPLAVWLWRRSRRRA